MRKKISDIHTPNTIEILVKNKVILPDNFINQPMDKQKKDLKKMCEENNLQPIYKGMEKQNG